MPHIHTEPGQHDHTVTAYIVRTDGDEPKALLHMHRKLHKLLPVGGHIELAETPWQAIAHEITEESGYALDSLAILQPTVRIDSAEGIIIHPYPIVANTHDITDDHFHSDTAYALIAGADPTGKPAENESADLRWVTLNELSALPSSEIWQNTRQIYTFILSTALHHWEQVPTSQFSLDGVRIGRR